MEATLHVDTFHLLNGSKDCLGLLVVQHFGRAKFDMARYRYKKWYFVDEHDVTSQNQVLILGHNGSRDVNRENIDGNGGTPRTVFPLREPTSGPKMFSAIVMSQ
jgi:hypothetical protein